MGSREIQSHWLIKPMTVQCARDGSRMAETGIGSVHDSPAGDAGAPSQEEKALAGSAFSVWVTAGKIRVAVCLRECLRRRASSEQSAPSYPWTRPRRPRP